MAPANFAFVEAGDFGKLKAVDRKLIRSHCMLGKNKKKDGSDIPTPTKRATSMKSRSPRPNSTGRQSKTVTPEPVAQVPNSQSQSQSHVLSPFSYRETVCPPPPPVNLAMPRFAFEIDDTYRDLLFSYFVKSRDTRYEVESCVEFEFSRSLWWQWLFEDGAFLQSALAYACAHDDLSIVNTGLSSRTHAEMRKTLNQLNKNLSDANYSLRDSTISVVLSLIALADCVGDDTAVTAHTIGLREMIKLRGGLYNFRHDTKLFIKLCHMDLAMNLAYGETPQLHNDTVTWESIIDTRRISSCCSDCVERSPSNDAINGLPDQRLKTVFSDLQQFTRMMNKASTGPGAQRLKYGEFQTILASIQYRLLQLQDTQHSSLAECVRLAMLAFMTTIFRVAARAPRHDYLVDRLSECCLALEPTPAIRDLMLWVLMITATSSLRGDEHWLWDVWAAHIPASMTWPEASRSLQCMPWVNVVHNAPAAHIFRFMQALSAGEVPDMLDSPRSTRTPAVSDLDVLDNLVLPSVLRRERF
ncbi:hypothetical protein GQ53DRAFT_722036 [Thozetella sp. PMI_491]|nr:hypothetical protein GQ53DRAFT_722036 [Thozetella sp. PMI_491]